MRLRIIKKEMIFGLLIAILFFCTEPINAQSNVDLQKGLIGHYSFNDKANDESGNENDGEIDGPNYEKDISGLEGNSFRWNDDDDKIVLPIDLNIGVLPKVTFSAWVYPISGINEIVVLSNDDRGGDRKIFATKKDGKIVWAISDGKGGSIGKVAVERGKWVFLVALYNEDTKKASIIVDGVRTNGKTTIDMGSPNTWIGANPCGNDDFEAYIDEVRIYDRLLSMAEIDSLQKLHPIIDNFIKEEEAPENYFYLVKQDNLNVRSLPTIESKTIGTYSKVDTLYFDEEVPTKGKKYNEWLKVEIDGKVGYVNLKYIKQTTIEEEEMLSIIGPYKEYMDWTTWQFWVIVVLIILIGFVGSFKFASIDQLLNRITNNDYEGNIAFFPLIVAFSGVLLAFLTVFWQGSVEYYLTENFSLLPKGYGFVAWTIWAIIVIDAIFFILLLIESFACGNIIHGLIRIILQLILTVFAFISAFIIALALIVIVIIIVVISIFLSAIFYKRVYTDAWGNKYVER